MSNETHSHKHTRLGQFFATSVCGNDILSSALYVSGIAAIYAGVYAPIILLCVALVLFFYRTVYREVVEALPVNGGAYNALLNGTSKTIAATAGVMTILSYIATAVISAKTAVEYLFKFIEKLFEDSNSITAENLESFIIPAIILVLFAFALLVISGVKDSAKVAAGIFVFHIITLTGFIIIGLIYALNHGVDMFSVNKVATGGLIENNEGLIKTLFFAFSASLLGVSGFESSANFVEEQKKGVFKLTLRNMLIGVAIFNPLIALVVLNILPLEQITFAKDFLLAEAAFTVGGILLLGWIAIDAFLVLCGAVLTSYVGVIGLVTRMSLDECLPSSLFKENKKGSHPRIILTFFALCASILLITGGDLLSLAGVYTISFLGVMTLFALGNLILRQTRTELKRPYKAPILFVFAAFLSTFIGLIGNSVLDFRNVQFFLIYFIPAVLLVFTIIYKKDVIKSILPFTKKVRPLYNVLSNTYYKAIRSKFYVFIHHSNRLYPILDYINNNENGANIKIVHCKNGDEHELEKIKDLIPKLKEAGVFPHFNIEFEYIDEEFGPDAIENFAKHHNINKNRIFIGSIHHHHEFDYEDLGGVRIVF
jgi:amino acid transporter